MGVNLTWQADISGARTLGDLASLIRALSHHETLVILLVAMVKMSAASIPKKITRGQVDVYAV